MLGKAATLFVTATAAVQASSSCQQHPSPIKILQGGYNSTYAILEFNPYVTPNTLEVVKYYDTADGHLKAWLSQHPTNPSIILGVNDDAHPDKPGYMTSYYLNRRTGKLTFIDAVDTGGYPVPDYSVAAAHGAFFPDGLVAGVANYFGQSAATFRFDPITGHFGEKINTNGTLDFPGYTPVPGQIGTAGDDTSSQATAHPHMIAPHPWLDVLYLPDLGEDRLKLYKIGEDGTLSNLTYYQLPYGHGPRHLTIDPAGQRLYLLLELAAQVRSYDINQMTGELTETGEDLPIYNPENTTFSLELSGAEVHVSNDGRFVYATQRNLTAAAVVEPSDPADIIAVYAVSPTDGSLTRIQSAMVNEGGRQLRAMELSPIGPTAVAGGQDYLITGGLVTNNTFVFKRDRATGMLDLVASTGRTYQPSTYIWL
ncbi:Lactonase, 7-bladed beta-propeller-domain-containing protein [Xylaria arbuscula]|nr:Lactonase, 7-bladed beta-propeller-domain-containing protein [Xylaria arbuscula]